MTHFFVCAGTGGVVVGVPEARQGVQHELARLREQLGQLRLTVTQQHDGGGSEISSRSPSREPSATQVAAAKPKSLGQALAASIDRAGQQVLPKKEGWLVKQGHVVKNWKKRWFRTSGRYLYYFKQRGDRRPLGQMFLRGCKIKGGDDLTITLLDPDGGKNMVLRAADKDDYNSWQEALHLLCDP